MSTLEGLPMVWRRTDAQCKRVYRFMRGDLKRTCCKDTGMHLIMNICFFLACPKDGNDFVCACVYMCIYVCVRVCVHTRNMCVCACVCRCVCVCVCMCMCVWCMCACMCVCVCVCMHVCVLLS